MAKWLASRVGVTAAVVCLGRCTGDACGLKLPVTIGPLPASAAGTVSDKLRECTSNLAEVVKIFGVPVAVEEPLLESQMWTFCEAVLYAAGTTARTREQGTFACAAAHMIAGLMTLACPGSRRCGDSVRRAQRSVPDAA